LFWIIRGLLLPELPGCQPFILFEDPIEVGRLISNLQGDIVDLLIRFQEEHLADDTTAKLRGFEVEVEGDQLYMLI
jgi:hypothetical protein